VENQDKKQIKEWSVDFNYCRKCHGTKYKHILDGYCQPCFKQLESEEATITKQMRRCLMCCQKFYSTGSGNRRCDLCARKNFNFNSARYRININ
jgi:hypothetical protein